MLVCTAPLEVCLYILLYTRFLAFSLHLFFASRGTTMGIEVVRSPSKLWWHVIFNKSVIAVSCTKREAMSIKAEYDKKLGELVTA